MNGNQEGLTAVLDAQRAAVYLYGVIYAYAAANRRTVVADFTDQHRTARDAAAAALAATGATVPASPAAFTPPKPITDPSSAAAAAVAVEEDCAQAYRTLLGRAGDDATRRLGVDGLTDSAVRAARWRVALNLAPATPAFPGSPN
jgi:hypothetical protein